MSTNTNFDKTELNRRQLIKTAGVAAGGVAVGPRALDSISRDADAIAPFFPAAFAAGLAWTLRDIKAKTSDPPPDSLGPEALKDQVIQTVRTRKSTNASTLTDNKNLVTYVEEPAFVDGKVAAVKAINNGKTKSEVESAALKAANAHITTVENNFLSTWNESLNELESMVSSLKSEGAGTFISLLQGGNEKAGVPLTFYTTGTQLSDGSSKSVKAVGYDSDIKVAAKWKANKIIRNPYNAPLEVLVGDNIEYLSSDKWNSTWSEIQTVQTDVTNNLITWVDTAYSNVQSGELNPSELLTPSDLADEYSGENVRAIADLQALNIPNAGGNEATIKLNGPYNSKLTGLLAYSENTSDLSVGDTVDPSTFSGSWYISHDLSDWQADVTSAKYDNQYDIQGGFLRFTEDPKVLYGNNYTGKVLYAVQTVDNEVARVTPADFGDSQTDDSGNTYWEVDLSSKLNTVTTEADTIFAVYPKDETVYQTQILDETFEILETADGALTFEQPREPQTDNNYITQEEWDKFKRQTRENLDSWRDTQTGGGIGFDGPGNLLGDLPSFPGFSTVESVIIAVAAYLGIDLLRN